MKPHGAPLTLVGMAWRNLYRQPIRTLLTALGISLGVAAIVAFGAITEGMWVTTDEALHYNEGALMVFQRGVVSDLLSLLPETETRQALLADPDVVAAAPLLWHLIAVDRQPFFLVVGLEPAEFDRHRQQLTRGRLPAADNEVVIGELAARRLNKSVGDAILLDRQQFTVTGVFDAGVLFFNGAVSVRLEPLQDMLGRHGKVTSFQVRVRPGADPGAVAGRIMQDQPHVVAVTDAQAYHNVDKSLEIANGFVWAVSLIAIIIGSVIVANTMWMSVHERTREFGVLRAVGWSRGRLMRTVLIESVWIGALGGLLGCAIGSGLASLVRFAPVASQYLKPVYASSVFVKAGLVAVLLSIAGGLLPAWRAGRIAPVEALRYE